MLRKFFSWLFSHITYSILEKIVLGGIVIMITAVLEWILRKISIFTPYIIFGTGFFIVILCFIYMKRKSLKSLDKTIRYSPTLTPKKVIYDPTKHPEPQFLIEGNNCFWIPNPETFEYLAKLFGFWWNTSEPMLPADIESKFVRGEDLPKIQDFFPKKS